MRLPTGWNQVEAGHCVHVETGVEIIKNGSTWQVRIPGRAGKDAAGRYRLGPDFKTRAAALESDTVSDIIPKLRRVAAAAHRAAQLQDVGRPDTWPGLGEVDETTALARHAAVTAAELTTGFDAKPGQIVVHIELGTLGIFHGSTADCAAVHFDGEPGPLPVHAGDVVVIDWYSCRRLGPDHDEHGQAVTTECLTEGPEDELEGPKLIEVTPDRYVTSDGIEVTRNRDGSWDAWGISFDKNHFNRSICSHQSTVGRTHHWINAWRERRRTFVDQVHTEALALKDRQPELADLVDYNGGLYEVSAVCDDPAELLLHRYNSSALAGEWVPTTDVVVYATNAEVAADESIPHPIRQRATWSIQWKAERQKTAIKAHGTLPPADPTRPAGALFFDPALDGWELVGDGQVFAFAEADVIGAQLWAAKRLCPTAPGSVRWEERTDDRGVWYSQVLSPGFRRVSETQETPPRDPDDDGKRNYRIKYLIETRVSEFRWDSESGETPPVFGDSQSSLDELAETILKNVVESHTRDPWAAIRVSTWRAETPRVGHARRDSVRFAWDPNGR